MDRIRRMSDDATSSVNSYDAVPYPGQPYRQTHPQWLAALAQLLSIPAPPPQSCRVLELGCCDGGNLIAMAVGLHNAKFVGVDYSPVQIEIGRKTVDHLKLSNVDLHALSILDIPSDWGPFDYILCHGVFSWVPAGVQEKILEICSTMLAPDGIAYISYNALPGWHLRGIVRDMMRYHALRFDSPERRIQEAKLILDFIAQHAVGSHAVAYSMFLKSEAEMLRKLPDHYLYHEHLEDHSEPFYFHEFVEHARGYDLEYLAEAALGSMAPTNFGPVADRALSAIATNLIELEQFMDFLGNRTFRETLLRHTGRAVATYTIEPQSLGRLYITGKCRPQTQVVDLRPEKPVTFESYQNKHPITTSNPLLKAALLCLVNEFPGSISFDSLVERAQGQLLKVNVNAADTKRAAEQLGKALLQLLTTSSLLEISSLPACFTTTPGAKPLASSLARLQAETSMSMVTLRHDIATLGESESAVLKLLDGTRTTGEIAAVLGRPEKEIGQMIDRLARYALLVF